MGNRSEWLQDSPSKQTAYMREWGKTDKGKAYKEKHNAYMREWRLKNQERFKASQKRAYNKMRYDCLSHYAGGTPACKCCGEAEILFLHIDHVNGDGADHRRALKAEIGYYPGGNNLPYWLKKNGYPEGFQVLCANCNLGKRIAKDCPHALKLQV